MADTEHQFPYGRPATPSSRDKLMAEVLRALAKAKRVAAEGLTQFSDDASALNVAVATLGLEAGALEDAASLSSAEVGERCHADRDGDCAHPNCPQLRDGEPVKSDRACPIDTWPDDDDGKPTSPTPPSVETMGQFDAEAFLCERGFRNGAWPPMRTTLRALVSDARAVGFEAGEAKGRAEGLPALPPHNWSQLWVHMGEVDPRAAYELMRKALSGVGS